MKEIIEKYIREFIQNHQTESHSGDLWQAPLIAYASAQDPLFGSLKKIVGASHAFPSDLVKNAKTVISYFIPFSQAVNLSNRQGSESSKQWLSAYIKTNRLISAINDSLHLKLKESNFHSAVLPPTHNFDKQKLVSDWSHKHVAYIAGLGKFGLHQMLITEKGCSGRLGSLVTDLEIPPTQRSSREYCLYFHNQTCRLCVLGCVSGALKIDSFDRQKCYAHLLENAATNSDLGYADACGKCVSNVPCSFTNPVR